MSFVCSSSMTRKKKNLTCHNAWRKNDDTVSSPSHTVLRIEDRIVSSRMSTEFLCFHRVGCDRMPVSKTMSFLKVALYSELKISEIESHQKRPHFFYIRTELLRLHDSVEKDVAFKTGHMPETLSVYRRNVFTPYWHTGPEDREDDHFSLRHLITDLNLLSQGTNEEILNSLSSFSQGLQVTQLVPAPPPFTITPPIFSPIRTRSTPPPRLNPIASTNIPPNMSTYAAIPTASTDPAAPLPARRHIPAPALFILALVLSA